MSKIGKQIINYETNNLVNLDTYNKVSVVSAFGCNAVKLPSDLSVSINYDKNFIKLQPKNSNPRTLALWGLYNRHLFNTIRGINNLYMKKLELRGVGFKGEIINMKDKRLFILNLGYSHQVYVNIPKNIIIFPTLNKFKKTTNFILLGINKQQLNELVSYIISLKQRDPYKGKGIFFEGEMITLKEGKKQGS